MFYCWVRLTSAAVVWRYFDDAGGQELGQQVVNVLLTEAFLRGRSLWDFDDAGGQKFEQQVVDVHLRGFRRHGARGYKTGSAETPQRYSRKAEELTLVSDRHWSGTLDWTAGSPHVYLTDRYDSAITANLGQRTNKAAHQLFRGDPGGRWVATVTWRILVARTQRLCISWLSGGHPGSHVAIFWRVRWCVPPVHSTSHWSG